MFAKRQRRLSLTPNANNFLARNSASLGKVLYNASEGGWLVCHGHCASKNLSGCPQMHEQAITRIN